MDDDKDLARLDATATAALVRTGEVSVAEVVDAAIARVEAVDPIVNAVVIKQFEQARARAAAPGALPEGPFRGVPFLWKDLVLTIAGEPCYGGSRFLKDHDNRATVTSYLAQRFLDAGVVSLGRTNVPEDGTVVTTEPASFGPTRNPWDLDHSTGGSSGGSAAAVASLMVPAAHANDGGGSIRLPASECGLVGLKPSRGRVSMGPAKGATWAGATIEGTLTRTVRDTAGFLDVISGPMPGDPYVAPAPLRAFVEEVGAPVEPLRIGVATASTATGPADPECVAAVEVALTALEAMGHDVDTDARPPFDDPEFGARYVTIVAAWVAHDVKEWGRWAGEEVPLDALEPHNAVFCEIAKSFTASDYVASEQWLQAFTRRVNGWWAGGWDLLVTPTVGETPPRLGEFAPEADNPAAALMRCVPLIPFLSPFNVSGQPAISLPLHQTGSGLPVGVQLVAAWGREDLLLRVASALEDALPWADRTPKVFATS